MGFLARHTYKSICRAMMGSYKSMKSQNPNASEKELLALTLSLRPTYRRDPSDSFKFVKNSNHHMEIKNGDDLKDVIRNVIILETVPRESLNHPDSFASIIKEMMEVINKEVV